MNSALFFYLASLFVISVDSSLFPLSFLLSSLHFLFVLDAITWSSILRAPFALHFLCRLLSTLQPSYYLRSWSPSCPPSLCPLLIIISPLCVSFPLRYTILLSPFVIFPLCPLRYALFFNLNIESECRPLSNASRSLRFYSPVPNLASFLCREFTRGSTAP